MKVGEVVWKRYQKLSRFRINAYDSLAANNLLSLPHGAFGPLRIVLIVTGIEPNIV